MPTPVNLHWKYYFDYFHEPNAAFPAQYRAKPTTDTNRFGDLRTKNETLTAVVPSQYGKDVWKTLEQGNRRFSLKTTYPGLLVGSGYRHETGSTDELKLGFSFDYTTGLPIIPGSSVKGLLRSAFPGDRTKNQLHDRADAFIRYLLKTAVEFSVENLPTDFVTRLETELFGPLHSDERLAGGPAVSQSDIFYDAVIGVDERGAVHTGKLFGNDFITPHLNRKNPKMSPFTNPIPIQFLKVMPKVPITFQFDLRERPNQLLPVDERLALFKAIIGEFGVGAKTRVGYGQLQ